MKKVVICNEYGGRFHISENDITWMMHHFKDKREDYPKSPYQIERTDLRLVYLVEVGAARAKDLVVCAIPDDIEYTIENYDGNEWIAEKPRKWNEFGEF